MHKILATFLVFTSIVAQAEGGRPRPIHTIDKKQYFCTLQTAGGKTAELNFESRLSSNSVKQYLTWTWQENVNEGQPTFVLREELLTNVLKGRTDLSHMDSGTLAGRPNSDEENFSGAGGLLLNASTTLSKHLSGVPLIKDQVQQNQIPLRFVAEEYNEHGHFMIRMKDNVASCENCDIGHILMEELETSLKITPHPLAEQFDLTLEVKLRQNLIFDMFEDKDGKSYNGKPVSTLLEVLKVGDTALSATGTCRLL